MTQTTTAKHRLPRRRKNEIARPDEREFNRLMLEWLGAKATLAYSADHDGIDGEPWSVRDFTLKTRYGELKIHHSSLQTTCYTLCTRFADVARAQNVLGSAWGIVGGNTYSGKYNFHLDRATPPWDAAADIISRLEGLR